MTVQGEPLAWCIDEHDGHGDHEIALMLEVALLEACDMAKQAQLQNASLQTKKHARTWDYLSRDVFTKE